MVMSIPTAWLEAAPTAWLEADGGSMMAGARARRRAGGGLGRFAGAFARARRRAGGGHDGGLGLGSNGRFAGAFAPWLEAGPESGDGRAPMATFMPPFLPALAVASAPPFDPWLEAFPEPFGAGSFLPPSLDLASAAAPTFDPWLEADPECGGGGAGSFLPPPLPRPPLRTPGIPRAFASAARPPFATLRETRTAAFVGTTIFLSPLHVAAFGLHARAT